MGPSSLELLADVEKEGGTHVYVVTRKGYDIRHIFRSPVLYGGEVALIAIMLASFGVMVLQGTLTGLSLARENDQESQQMTLALGEVPKIHPALRGKVLACPH